MVSKEFRHNMKKVQEYRNIKISNMIKITCQASNQKLQRKKRNKNFEPRRLEISINQN